MPTLERGAGAISLPWGAWRLDEERAFAMPPAWRVHRLAMRGRQPLTGPDIRAALDRPIGAPPVGDLVAPGDRVAIAVDDLTRPTPAAPILEALLERLQAAGIDQGDVTIVIASGAHRPATADDIARKIGPALAGRLRVVSHDPHGPLADTGVRLAGVPIRLNPEFLAANVRIGIGAVMPHPFAAFSGGGKIVVPGLADLDVLARTHKYALMGLTGGHELHANRFRRDMEAAVREIGLPWTINVVIGAGRTIAGLAAGDLVGAHRAAADMARDAGWTDGVPHQLDALLVNAYPKDGELLQIEAALVPLRGGGIDWLTPSAPIVLMAACPDGLGAHGLFGPGGRLFRAPSARASLGGRPLIVFSPGVTGTEARAVFWEGYAFHDTWSGVVRAVSALVPGDAHVGVMPCGPLQVAAPKV